MILILLYWIGLFVIFTAVGIGVQRIFQLESLHPILVPILGSFAVTIVAGIWAFFAPLNDLFDFVIFVVVVLLSTFLESSIKVYMKSVQKLFSKLSPFLKIFAGFIILLAAIKSAGLPSIIDNESYYLQTIKWLDNYGWVHGLANLHPFLGQQSGWHLMHSAMNMNDFTTGFNDINGFYLVLANIYALSHLSFLEKENKAIPLTIGLLPVFNIFLFQFIDAPSPDLGIYLIGYFIFAEYLKRKQQNPTTVFALLSLLAIWAVFIKGTGIFLAIFPLAYLFENQKIVDKWAMIRTVSTGCIVTLLFFGKNLWVTGYAIFPLDFWSMDVPWKLPESMMSFLNSQMQPAGYKMTAEQLAEASVFQQFKHWFLLPKLSGLFNIGMTLLLVIFPFFIKKTRNPKASFWLYIGALSQMILLWATSPQYRFFFGFMMLLLLVLLSQILQNRKLIHLVFSTVSLAVLGVILLPSTVGKLSSNDLQKNSQVFSLSTFVEPMAISQYSEVQFSEEKNRNLRYYDPIELEFFWGTGDGPLPCLQKEQLEYFETYFRLVPQPLGENLGDGFYAQQLD